MKVPVYVLTRRRSIYLKEQVDALRLYIKRYSKTRPSTCAMAKVLLARYNKELQSGITYCELKKKRSLTIFRDIRELNRLERIKHY